MLLRHTGTCTTGKTVDFLGRRITNKGDHFLKSHSTAVRPTTYYKKPTYSKQHLQLHQEQQLQHLHLHKMSYSTSKNTDENWAGCHVTRKSTTGFVIQLLGTTVRFGYRTQAVVAPSSAESEFYAIGTRATEALHLKNFLGELLQTKSISRCTRTARPAKVWLHASASPKKPSTLN